MKKQTYMKQLSLSLLTLFFSVSLATAQTKTIAYQELPDAMGNATGSGMFFGATMDADSITVNFGGIYDRWIALGFGTSMNPTDVLVFSEGKSGASHAQDWFDYYNSSSSISGVNKDASQDWVILSSNILGGVRAVTAKRALNTGDNNDAALSFNDATLRLVWAKGASASFTLNNHSPSNRAYGINLTWQATTGIENADAEIRWTQQNRHFEVEATNALGFEIMVTDMQGKEVFSGKNMTSFDLPNARAGLYVMSISANGKGSTAKILLQ